MTDTDQESVADFYKRRNMPLPTPPRRPTAIEMEVALLTEPPSGGGGYCGGCANWRPTPASGHLKGECRLLGPRIGPRPWPATRATDWCRQFQPEKKADESGQDAPADTVSSKESTDDSHSRRR